MLSASTQPGIAIVPQVALYNAFHRHRTNRRIHAATAPSIMASGAMLTALVPLPFASRSGPLPANLALVFFAVCSLLYLALDPLVGFAHAAIAMPTLVLMNLAAQRLSVVANITINALVQGVAWYLAVHVGHDRLERVVVRDALGGPPYLASSNVYFERGYFVLRNVGRRATFVESLTQFAISPFVVALDALFALGYAPALERRIADFTQQVVDRLARGEPLLGSLDEHAIASSVDRLDRDPVEG
jgi:uncharacterized membrane protein YGL010W